jgi:aldose 1-epimerase
LFTLKNKNGLVSQITNYGGRVANLWVPDKDRAIAELENALKVWTQYTKNGLQQNINPIWTNRVSWAC